MVDTITPSFIDLLQSAALSGPRASAAPGPAAVLRSSDRRRIVGGKSARMLRAGDTVSRRDLGLSEAGGTGDAQRSRVTTVAEARTSLRDDLVRIRTVEGEAFLVRGSRLVVVMRTQEPSAVTRS